MEEIGSGATSAPSKTSTFSTTVRALYASSVSMSDGALLEPLAVGINAGLTGGIRLGDTVLITGAGCIGIMCLLTAKAMATGSILVCDIVETRLALAERLEAVAVLASGENVLSALGGTGILSWKPPNFPHPHDLQIGAHGRGGRHDFGLQQPETRRSADFARWSNRITSHRADRCFVFSPVSKESLP